MKHMTSIISLHRQKLTIWVLFVLACVTLLTFVYLEHMSMVPTPTQFQCENMSKENRDICLAIASGEPQSCANITDSFDGEVCLQGIAVNTQNESLCEELGGGIFNTDECLETIHLYSTVDRRFFASDMPLIGVQHSPENPRCVESWYLYYKNFLTLRVCENEFPLPQACEYKASTYYSYEAIICFNDIYSVISDYYSKHGYLALVVADYSVTYDRLRATAENLLSDWGYSPDEINTITWPPRQADTSLAD